MCFCVSQTKLFPVAAGWRFHCALKFVKKKAKQREAVLYLLCKTVVSEKVLCVFILFLPCISLERINLKLLTNKYSFISSC